MRQFITFSSLSALCLCVVFSCQNSAEDKSAITKLRLQHVDADQAIYLGQDIQLAGEVALDNPISGMQVMLKNSKGAVHNFQIPAADKALGKPTYRLSEELHVPDTIRPGKYFLVLTVSASASEIFTDSIPVSLAIDGTMPLIGDLDVGINNKKDDLHLEASLSAVKKIDRVEIRIEGASWSTEKSFDKPSINGQLSVNFHEHMHVSEAPEGTYQVLLTLYDQAGRKAVSTGSFTK